MRYPVINVSDNFLVIEQYGTIGEYQTYGGILYDYKRYGRWHTRTGWIAKKEGSRAFGPTAEEAIAKLKLFENQ